MKKDFNTKIFNANIKFNYIHVILLCILVLLSTSAVDFCYDLK